MEWIDVILLLIIVAIVGGAIAYIVKAKKSGVKCIGCPAAGNCASAKNGNCVCHSDIK